MSFLSGFALVMLTLVGYASGMTLIGRYKNVAPLFWDLVIVAGLWFGAFYFRDQVGHWLSLFVWLAIALTIAAILTAVRLQDVPAAIPESELPEHVRERIESAVDQNPFRRAWRAWSSFAEDMGNVQGRLLMGFFYFLIITPFGLGYRLVSDPLTMKQRPSTSGWVAKEAADLELEAAKNQG